MSRFQFRPATFKMVFFMYLLGTVIFAILYLLPVSHKQPLLPSDAFFLSASAISATGLSTVTVAQALTTAGKIILLIQMEIGGIGVMALVGALLIVLRTNAPVPSQTLMIFDQNQNSSRSISKLMAFIVTYTLIVEAAGFLLILPAALHHGSHSFAAFFLSVSTFTNAGFEISGNGLDDFKGEPFVLAVLTCMIILGVLGFAVVMEFLQSRRKKKSLYFKVNVLMHGILLLAGFLFFFFVDFIHMPGLSFTDKIIQSFFFSAAPRSGGLASLDLHVFSFPSLLFMIVLMFIGGSPSSCAGGIRTTTFAVILAKLWSVIRGSNETHMFRRTLFAEDVNKAFLVFFAFLFLFFFSFFVLSFTEKAAPFPLAFEIMSALSTCGFSLGITAGLTVFGKIWLAFLMLIGRLGVIILIYTFMNQKKSTIKYAKESILIG
ncbi:MULTISPECIES: TrkH family potassium uptake protein [Heyndrickxia]|uniref:TrkH family potassium uptake protein n=1 Tax=Heyndrickxia TaxID=2837504 RepID=UPI000210FE3E|nr:potassium transporter TrkG [Heyndrickxia coagulans]AEH53365.1 H(+)-transporting two-sector ATPase [Heyndrickxia coagulans 2-6]MED4312943.1 potassium transporter TrkG [Heyndrickxia coagulans]